MTAQRPPATVVLAGRTYTLHALPGRPGYRCRPAGATATAANVRALAAQIYDKVNAHKKE